MKKRFNRAARGLSTLTIAIVASAGVQAGPTVPNSMGDEKLKSRLNELAVSLSYSIGCPYYDQTADRIHSVLSEMAKKGYFQDRERKIMLESSFNSYFARWCGKSFGGLDVNIFGREQLESSAIQKQCYDPIMQWDGSLRKYLHQLNDIDPANPNFTGVEAVLPKLYEVPAEVTANVSKGSLSNKLKNGKIQCIEDLSRAEQGEAIFDHNYVNNSLEPFGLKISKGEGEEWPQKKRPAPEKEEIVDSVKRPEGLKPLDPEVHSEESQEKDEAKVPEALAKPLGGFMRDENGFPVKAQGYFTPDRKYHKYKNDEEQTNKHAEELGYQLDLLFEEMEAPVPDKTRFEEQAWRLGAYISQTLRWNYLYLEDNDMPSSAPDFAKSFEGIASKKVADICEDKVPALDFMQEKCQQRLLSMLSDFVKPFWIDANNDLKQIHGSAKENRDSEKMLRYLVEKSQEDGDNIYKRAVTNLEKHKDTLQLLEKLASVIDPHQYDTLDEETVDIMRHYSTLAPPLDWVTWHVKKTQFLDDGKTPLEQVVDHRSVLYDRRRMVNEYIHRTNRAAGCSFADDALWFNGAKMFLLKGNSGYSNEQIMEKILADDGDLMEACRKELAAEGKDPQACFERLRGPLSTMAKAFSHELYDSIEKKPEDIGRMVEVLDAARAYAMNRDQIRNFDVYVAAIPSFAVIDKMADAMDEIKKARKELGLPCGIEEDDVYHVNEKLVNLDSDLGTMYFKATGARVTHQLVNADKLDLNCPKEFTKKRLCIHDSRDVVVLDPGQNDDPAATRNQVSSYIHEGLMSYATTIFVRDFLLSCAGEYDGKVGLDPKRTVMTRHAEEDRYGQFSMAKGNNGTIQDKGGSDLGAHINHLVKGKKSPLILSIHYNAGNGYNVKEDRPEAFYPRSHDGGSSEKLARRLYDGVKTYTGKYYETSRWWMTFKGKNKYVKPHPREKSIRPLHAKSGAHQTLFECMFMDGYNVKEDLRKSFQVPRLPTLRLVPKPPRETRKPTIPLTMALKFEAIASHKRLLTVPKASLLVYWSNMLAMTNKRLFCIFVATVFTLSSGASDLIKLPTERSVLAVGSDHVVLRDNRQKDVEIYSTKGAKRLKPEFIDEESFVKATFSRDEKFLLLEHFDLDTSFFRIMDMDSLKVVSGVNQGTRDLISIGWEDNCRYHVVRWQKKQLASGESKGFAVDQKEVSKNVLRQKKIPCGSAKDQSLSHAFQDHNAASYAVLASGIIVPLEELPQKNFPGMSVRGANEVWMLNTSQGAVQSINLNTRAVKDGIASGALFFAVARDADVLAVAQKNSVSLRKASAPTKSIQEIVLKSNPESLWLSPAGDTLVIKDAKGELSLVNLN